MGIGDLIRCLAPTLLSETGLGARSKLPLPLSTSHGVGPVATKGCSIELDEVEL